MQRAKEALKLLNTATRGMATASSSSAPAVPSHVKIPDVFENFQHQWPKVPPMPTIPSGASFMERQRIMEKYYEDIIYHGPHMYRLDLVKNPKAEALKIGFVVLVVPILALSHAIYVTQSKFRGSA